MTANTSLSGLRGSHLYQQVYNVANEVGEGETVNGTFRILGGHRVSEWAVSDYAALVVSSFYSSSIAEPTVYNTVMTESEFESVRDRLKLSGLACGLELAHDLTTLGNARALDAMRLATHVDALLIGECSDQLFRQRLDFQITLVSTNGIGQSLRV